MNLKKVKCVIIKWDFDQRNKEEHNLLYIEEEIGNENDRPRFRYL